MAVIHRPLNCSGPAAALDELAAAIALAQGSGAFTLLLARCNYRQLQRQMVGVLLGKLADADLLGPVRVIDLGDRDENLYARIHDLFQVEAAQGQTAFSWVVATTTHMGQPLLMGRVFRSLKPPSFLQETGGLAVYRATDLPPTGEAAFQAA